MIKKILLLIILSLATISCDSEPQEKTYTIVLDKEEYEKRVAEIENEITNKNYEKAKEMLLEIEKYNKDRKIEVECFYYYGFLKKIIYYNEDQTINNIDYFNIYYDNEQPSISAIYLFFISKMDKYFKIKNLEEKDIKIYGNTEYGFEFLENYPSNMIKANKEALILKILIDDIEIEQEDIEYFIDDLKSFPTITEYYSNNKIIKKDIFKVERVMEISDNLFFNTNLTLQGVLEKTEYYNKDNKVDKIKEINKFIYVTEAGFSEYFPRIEF